MLGKTLFAMALCAASLTAQALTFERNTTIHDDFNGHATIQSSGALGEDSGTRLAEMKFTNFHPREATRFVDGTITREAVRDGELVTVSYDGTLTLHGNASNNGNGNPQQLDISFVDLKVVRNGEEEGADLSGQLVVNGKTLDAATAPGQVRAVLLGLLRFFRV